MGLAPHRLLEELKQIIRRDLNIGKNEPIPDDMPLVGGRMDLDSLDVLMLVTSIEKRFAVKIIGANMGREAFASVASLANFIQANMDAGAPASNGAVAKVDVRELVTRLPHKPPFLFVDELLEVAPGQSARGLWHIKGDEAFLAGHFPGRPLTPGVLIAEALAQLSGLVMASGASVVKDGRLAQVNVRFRQPVAPPARLILESQAGQGMGALQQFEVTARLDEQVVADGQVTLFQIMNEPAEAGNRLGGQQA